MIVRSKQSGQNLVEFSLVLVFLIFVVFGVLDLGRVFFSIITISNAAREGARYLTTHRDDNYNSFDGTKDATVNEAKNSVIQIQKSDVTITGRSEFGGAPSRGLCGYQMGSVAVTALLRSS